MFLAVLGQFLQPNRAIDPPQFIDVTIGRPVEIQCPAHTFTYPASFIWGSIPASGVPIVLHTVHKRFVLSNGNLFYSYMEDSDLNEINNKLSGVSCILYILGKYRPSVKIRLRKQGGRHCIRNSFDFGISVSSACILPPPVGTCNLPSVKHI